MPALLQPRPRLVADIDIFVVAVQRVLDELTTVLQQIGTELSACTR